MKKIKFTHLLSVFLIVLTVLVVYTASRGSLTDSIGGNYKNIKEYYAVHSNDILKQKLSSKHQDIEGLIITFGPGAKDVTFSADIEIISRNNKKVYNITAGDIQDNGEVYLPLPSDMRKESPNIDLIIDNIHIENNQEIHIMVSDPIENLNLSMNEDIKDNRVLMVKYHLSSIPIWKISIIVLLAIFISVMLLSLEKKLVRDYVLISATLGILFSIYTPIHQTSDEWVHFLKSQDVAQGHLLTPKYNDEVGYFLSQKILDTYIHPLQRDDKYNLDINDYIKKHSINPDPPEEQIFEWQPTTAVYTIIPYIPQAIGIKIGMIFNTDILTANILGRILNLLVYIGLSAFALYKMPIMRRTFMFFLLSPIIIFHASSLSADGILMGTSFIFIALLLKLIFKEKKLSNKDLVILGVSGILMALCKFTYWPLLLLLLFIPYKKYGSKKRYFIVNSVVIGVATLLVAGWNLFVMGYVGDAVAAGNVSAIKQISFIVNNPIQALEVFVRSFDHGLDEWFVMFNVFGFLSTPLRGNYLSISNCLGNNCYN